MSTGKDVGADLSAAKKILEADTARETAIAFDMAFLGTTREEAAASHDRLELKMKQVKDERRQQYAAANIPAKIDPRLYGFQEYNDMFSPASFEDMYAFFKASDPAVTFDATVELKGVEFDDLSYRQLSPIHNDLIPAGKITLLSAYTMWVKNVVEASKGSFVAPNKGESIFYLRVRANADTFRALANLDGVQSIGLTGDPSNLRPERARQRAAELRAVIVGLGT